MFAGITTSAPAVKLIFPVPEASIDRSALEPLLTISFTVALPVIVGVAIVGLVKILFVNVCESVNVATVESIVNVTVLVEELVVIPVPPAKCKVSESKSIDKAVESSVLKSKSCAVTCEST